jgi:hypothetical protein
MMLTHYRNLVVGLSTTLALLLSGCADGNKPVPDEDNEGSTKDDEPEGDDSSDDSSGETSDDTGSETTDEMTTDPATMPAGPTVWFGFDTDTEAFALQDYAQDNPMYTNLFYTCSKMAGDEERLEVCDDVSLEWTDTPDPAEGADPGMLEVKVPFTGYNQSVELQKNIDPPMNLVGKVVKVKVWASADGFTPDPSAPGGGYVFVKTGPDYYYSHGYWVNFEADTRGTWIEFVLDAEFPEAFDGWEEAKHDATQVRSIGVQLSSGGGTNATEQPTAGVFHIDHLTIEAVQ